MNFKLNKSTFFISENFNIKYIYLILLIFTSVSTFFSYNGFGTGDQIEQLPGILSKYNSDIFQNDFFVNAYNLSFTRKFFNYFISFLKIYEDKLPILYFTLTVFLNFSIIFISLKIIIDIFNVNNIELIFIGPIILSFKFFELGWNNTIIFTSLIPSTFAVPLILYALYFYFKSSFFKAFLCLLIATLFHPLFGVEIFLLLFFIYIFYNKKVNKKYIFLIILIPIYLFYNQTDKDLYYIKILAFYRHPHHYLPSFFSYDNYLVASVFYFLVLYLIFNYNLFENNINKIIKLLYILIIFSLPVSYFFTEIIPIKYIVIAQAFRLLYITNWISLLIFYKFITYIKPPKVIYFILLITSYSIYIFIIFLILNIFIFKFRNNIFNMASVIFTGFFIFYSYNFQSVITITFFITSILLFSNTLFYFIFIFILFLSINKKIEKKLTQYFSINNNLGPDTQDIIDFSNINFKNNDIILTPPNWGQYRILTHKSIIIDYKCFPFDQNKSILWFKRLQKCYDANLNFSNPSKLDSNYKNITDNKLIEISKDFKNNFAILYKETNTKFKIIFCNKSYKIITLNEN